MADSRAPAADSAGPAHHGRNDTRRPTHERWPTVDRPSGVVHGARAWARGWPWIIFVGAASTALLAVTDEAGPLRAFVTIGFLLICPGMALVRLIDLGDVLAETTLAIATSVALTGLVAGALLYLGLWSPAAGLAILIAIALGGLVAGRLRERDVRVAVRSMASRVVGAVSARTSPSPGPTATELQVARVRPPIRRPIGSLPWSVPEPGSVLEPGDALAAHPPKPRFLESRSLGGTWLLDQLWNRLGLREIATDLLRLHHLDPTAERAIFVMVAKRALNTCSEGARASWVSENAVVPDPPELDEDRADRAMDCLVEIESDLAEQVYRSVADLIRLDVDLLFLHTVALDFESNTANPPNEVAAVGHRARAGRAKDRGPDVPRVTIGMAVTRNGVPLRVWTTFCNPTDPPLVRQVNDDLRAWRLGRVVPVAQRGRTSGVNRRCLEGAGSEAILGEKLHPYSTQAMAVLARRGRRRSLVGDLEVEEIVLGDPTERDRFVVSRDSKEAVLDTVARGERLNRLEAAIANTDDRSLAERREIARSLWEEPTYRRLLRVTADGLLRIDRAAAAQEASLDGTFLLRTAEPTLSAEDVARGYKQMVDLERAWRSMSATIDLRALRHDKQARVRAHVLLCWLALILIRIAENATGER